MGKSMVRSMANNLEIPNWLSIVGGLIVLFAAIAGFDQEYNFRQVMYSPQEESLYKVMNVQLSDSRFTSATGFRHTYEVDGNTYENVPAITKDGNSIAPYVSLGDDVHEIDMLFVTSMTFETTGFSGDYMFMFVDELPANSHESHCWETPSPLGNYNCLSLRGYDGTLTIALQDNQFTQVKPFHPHREQ